MTNKVTLRDIHKDNKAINRNLQRLANIELIRLLGRTAGLDVIHLNQQLTFIECVERYYQSITEGE